MRLQGFLGTGDDEVLWAMQTNLFAALRATRAAVPPMVSQGAGSIVNIASANAFVLRFWEQNVGGSNPIAADAARPGWTLV